MKTFVRGDLPARIMVRIAWGVVLLTGAILLAMFVSSCQSTGDSTASAPIESSTVSRSSATTQAVPASMTAPPAEKREEIPVSSYGDQLPPELAVSAPDSLVLPGSIVELTVEASPDVETLVLRDDLGREQSFTEGEGGVWHTEYRAPMKPGRHALSIKATNASERWSRSWVFVEVKSREESTQQ